MNDTKPCPFERFESLNSPHCWQYEVRLNNGLDDIKAVGKDTGWMNSLRTSDFYFEYVHKTDKEACVELSEFIKRHEFLGCLPNRPTHRFAARLHDGGILGGVVIMSTPNAFSHLLGKENRDLMKLVSRGASISWSPKNLGSWLLSRATRWMVANTEFRGFEAYSDPLAKELGTIYQALNWIYLGQTAGAKKIYRNPQEMKKGWFSDREFRKSSKYYKYALSIGISKEKWKTYMGKYSPQWDKMPDDVKLAIKQQESKLRNSCECRVVPPKHKYLYLLGRTKRETKELRAKFENNNPNKINLSYPKTRGIPEKHAMKVTP